MKRATDFFIILLLSLFMVEMEPVTLNHIVCHPDGASPQLHGLPFISHTTTPWVNSGEYSLYVFGYLLDIVFWVIVFYMAMKRLSRIHFNVHWLRILRISVISLLLPFLIVLLSLKFTTGARPQWTHPFDQHNCPVEVVFFPED